MLKSLFFYFISFILSFSALAVETASNAETTSKDLQTSSKTSLVLSSLENQMQMRKSLKESGYKIVRSHELSYGHLFVVEKTHVKNATSQKNSFQFHIEPNQVIKFDEFQKPIDFTSTSHKKSTPFNTKSSQDMQSTSSLFKNQWALQNTGTNAPASEDEPKPSGGVLGVDINALSAWKESDGSNDIIIAVMDTGLDITHPNLIQNIYVNHAEKNGRPGVDDDENGLIDDIHGYDFGDNDNNVSDYHGHGTHVSGIIGAVHGKDGIMGVMNRVKILPLKVFKDNNTLNTEGVVRALDYAVKLGAIVASNSWGGGEHSQIVENAIKEAGKSNLIFVASAGNSKGNNDESNKYPAGYSADNIISVASHNHRNQLSYFSNFGHEKVHLTAPGHYILSTFLGAQYRVWSGTSMAAPHVSGAIGLLVSQEGHLPYSQIKKRLLETTVPSFNYYEKTSSMGRLNIFNLLKDIRPDRGLPKENEWIDFKLETPITYAPIPKGFNKIHTWHVPGAKFIRLVIKDYSLVGGFFANIRDPKARSEFDTIQGTGEILHTRFTKSDRIGIRITSDRSSGGSITIEKIQYTK